jgi:Holliday junction resolvasome RuvABC endonuclease subunit
MFREIFFAKSLLAKTAVTPPADTADAISIAVVAMHAGHIGSS